ncbi:MAG: hypothetical protein JRN15_02710 [Nitrososphaerota archaeon]|jgi:hypothetical protein|nr:hypothetical protein [Nitrososphaerota archaeon]
MRTDVVFVSSLALSTGIIFAIYAMIGYAESSFASALGSSFRKGLEISVVLGVLHWLANQMQKLRRKLGGTLEAVSKKWKDMRSSALLSSTTKRQSQG